MLLAAGEVRHLGVEADPVLMFGERPKAAGEWRGRRLLWLNGSPAFELSYWCGTCQFLFTRLNGANQTCSLEELAAALSTGLAGLDDRVIDSFSRLLAGGEYLPMLLEVVPRLVRPVEPGDYFAEEQVDTWGLESFWGLPCNPRTPYYRTHQSVVDEGAHLFEFVVPMVPPSWNDREQVSSYERRLAASSAPTAVAVSTLDVCQPASDHGCDYVAHWGLTHFLLDGHHKLEAAAGLGAPLRLLSLLSVESSLATRDEVAEVPRLRACPPAGRPGRRPAGGQAGL